MSSATARDDSGNTHIEFGSVEMEVCDRTVDLGRRPLEQCDRSTTHFQEQKCVRIQKQYTVHMAHCVFGLSTRPVVHPKGKCVRWVSTAIAGLDMCTYFSTAKVKTAIGTDSKSYLTSSLTLKMLTRIDFNLSTPCFWCLAWLF